MSEPVTCSYLFTVEEFRTTLLLSRRLIPAWKKISVVVVVLGSCLMAGKDVCASFVSKGGIEYSVLPPLVLMAACSLFLLSKVLPIRLFCSTSSFQKGPLHDIKLSNCVSNDGISTRTSTSFGFIAWSRVTGVRESAQGFAVFSDDLSGFVWFPAHGFP